MSERRRNSRLVFNLGREEKGLLPQLASPFVFGVSLKAILSLESHREAFGNLSSGPSQLFCDSSDLPARPLESIPGSSLDRPVARFV